MLLPVIYSSQMATLNLRGVKITFPEGKIIENVTDDSLIEWLEYELGIISFINMKNPLFLTKLKNCHVEIDETLINGKRVNL